MPAHSIQHRIRTMEQVLWFKDHPTLSRWVTQIDSQGTAGLMLGNWPVRIPQSHLSVKVVFNTDLPKHDVVKMRWKINGTLVQPGDMAVIPDGPDVLRVELPDLVLDSLSYLWDRMKVNQVRTLALRNPLAECNAYFGRTYTDMELLYAAGVHCQTCGSGVAYPLVLQPHDQRSWCCARLLKEYDIAAGDHDVLPFSMYKVREETSINNRARISTRPPGTKISTVGYATCECGHMWSGEPYMAPGLNHHWYPGPCPKCGNDNGAAGESRSDGPRKAISVGFYNLVEDGTGDTYSDIPADVEEKLRTIREGNGRQVPVQVQDSLVYFPTIMRRIVAADGKVVAQHFLAGIEDRSPDDEHAEYYFMFSGECKDVPGDHHVEWRVDDGPWLKDGMEGDPAAPAPGTPTMEAMKENAVAMEVHGLSSVRFFPPEGWEQTPDPK